MCCLRLDPEANFFRQRLHAYGFSPVWILSCRIRLLIYRVTQCAYLGEGLLAALVLALVRFLLIMNSLMLLHR